MIYLITIACVIGIAVGQILFKLSSTSLSKSGSLFSFDTLIILIPALALYGITTLAWIWVLQKIELGKAYPFMALAFVLVPVGSHFLLGEKFNLSYFLGVALIMVGIIITLRSAS
ncbi:EamA family transporter [Cronobacter sakazakii]|uniref:4-amino-4-deoxy-L-arabinose-phospho-UDP flippase n=1 Tax=Cronobacter sakazakii TaxID=28141 RepID=A0AA45BY42_CROSK|nr:4-amino-4-deoxy-L-arabinose-phospho-UDP flippase [Cronobacter sakazakii]KAB0870075.1 4-amino-4-deoxy-L-arabinose-phospho-UDP flippase [Cronobacter sakazakii]KAB1054116.1 4-amino-4-deoxy-L-arabinose-phospho-UDP flippase [Cronobacter sakazakii]MCI0323443.1 4-amino-4-deoxy-L-arabinose-phospho-UDP flippase [Cronobacter sakazakii]PUE77891.1 4-amino-4-deoxy-L-arabinose-phospho-UDP flippase [Cronobacter sakazakii]